LELIGELLDGAMMPFALFYACRSVAAHAQ